MKKTRSNKAWLFVTPALVLLGFVAVLPLIMVVNYSFHDIFTLDTRVWVGLEWFEYHLRSSRFWESFGRSICFSAIVLFIEIPLGIAIALFMPRKESLLTALCIVSISIPLIVPWNMIAIIWRIFLAPDFFGGILSIIGFEAMWTMNALQTWLVIIAMDVWHWTSLVVLLCYSSLSTIPSEFYQAGAIDGASRWAVFRYIELPKLKGVLTIAILLRFVDSFMIYAEPFYLNAGGPRSSTTFLAMDLGQEFVSFEYGPAAARSVIYLIIIISVTWVFKMTANSRESKENHHRGR